METKYEVILCVINAGFSELVMDAAKEVGARGGTVIHARGTANKEAEQFFHITIQPDKEIVLILVQEDIKDKVLHAIYQLGGLKWAVLVFAFYWPGVEVVGLSAPVGASVPQPEANESEKNDNEALSENTDKKE